MTNRLNSITSSNKPKKIVLPLTTPPMRSLMYYKLGITFNSSFGQEWFYSSYLQMWNSISNNGWKIFKEKNPFVKSKKIGDYETEKMLKEDLIELLIKYLSEGNYIMILVDWLSLRDYPPKETYAHWIVINGYDIEKKVFIVSGYFPPEAHRVRSDEVSWEKICEAFFKIKKSTITISKNTGCKKGFSIFKFKAGIKSYYKSKITLPYLLACGTYISPFFKRTFGLKSHEYIRKDVKKLSEGKGRQYDFTFRLKSFEEYMEAMVLRCTYLKEKGLFKEIDNIIAEYKKLQKEYGLMVMLSLRYKESNNKKYLEQISDLSLKCDEDEKRALEELIKKF